MLPTQRILITGANGLLGQKLVQLYSQFPYNHYQVLATARGESRLGQTAAHIAYQPLDVTSQTEVAHVLAGFRPDVVIHTAAMTQVDQCETDRQDCRLLNVEAVRYLGEACRQQDTFLVHLSTDFIFDGTEGPLTEEARPNPLSFYGHSKLDAETLLQQMRGLRFAIARTILVYGITPDMSRSNIVLWVKNSLQQGKTIQVVDDQYRTPTLAEDLALGCHALAEKQITGIFHLGGPEMLTPYEMAIQTARFFNLDESLIEKTDSTRFTQPARRPPRTGFVIEKARRLLDYHPRNFTQGIKAMGIE